jgi:hypothetical protein
MINTTNLKAIIPNDINKSSYQYRKVFSKLYERQKRLLLSKLIELYLTEHNTDDILNILPLIKSS